MSVYAALYVFLQLGRSINEATAKRRRTAPFWTFQRSSSQVSEPLPCRALSHSVPLPPQGLVTERFGRDENHGCRSRTEKSTQIKKIIIMNTNNNNKKKNFIILISLLLDYVLESRPLVLSPPFSF